MYSTYNNYLGGVKIPESSMTLKKNMIEKYTLSPEQETKKAEKIENSESKANPKIWGPPMWFSLHVSAAHYPDAASPLVKERMKGRILAIPYEIPCSTCRAHAVAFIEKNMHNLDNIVSNKHSLGKFYTDFHNAVNKRYGKEEWSYEKVYKYYS